LNYDVFVKAQMVSQSEQLRSGCIAGRVLALRRVGKFCAWTKHMAMCIDRTRWQSEARFRRTVVPIQPACGFGEFARGRFAHVNIVAKKMADVLISCQSM
jgi:hypothetical protein